MSIKDRIRTGDLRHRITIQDPQNVDDGMGGSTINLVDVVTVWSSIEPLRGNERYQAQQIESDLSHNIKMRYQSGIKPQMQVSYGTRTFRITAVIDTEERHKELQLLCAEVVT